MKRRAPCLESREWLGGNRRQLAGSIGERHAEDYSLRRTKRQVLQNRLAGSAHRVSRPVAASITVDLALFDISRIEYPVTECAHAQPARVFESDVTGKST